MNMHKHIVDHHCSLVTCPECGSNNYEDNRLDEGLYREAVKEAPRLRFEGKNDEAIELLIAFYSIRIVNFDRLEWRCLDCGSAFDE